MSKVFNSPVALKVTVATDGKNKGKQYPHIMLNGAGWRGLEPYTVRLVIENLETLRAIVAHSDDDIIATANAQAYAVATGAMTQNSVELGMPVAQPQTGFTAEQVQQMINTAVQTAVQSFAQPQ